MKVDPTQSALVISMLERILLRCPQAIWAHHDFLVHTQDLQRMASGSTGHPADAHSKMLDEIWRALPVKPQSYDVALDLALIALQLGRWTQALTFLHHSIDDFGDSCVTRLNAARAYLQLGDCVSCQASLERAAILEPSTHTVESELMKLKAFRTISQERLGFEIRRDPVASRWAITLIGAHHAPQLRRYSQTPDLRRQLSLPNFRSSTMAEAWINDASSYQDQVLCAVLERHRGFIGLIGMDIDAESSAIHYWITPEFRRQGAAATSLSGMLQIARELGCQRVVARVRAGNINSSKTIERVGFSYVDAESNAYELLYEYDFRKIHN